MQSYYQRCLQFDRLSLSSAQASCMLTWNGHSSDSHTYLRDDQPSNTVLLSLRHSTPLMGTLRTRQSPFSSQTEGQSVAKGGWGLSPTLCWDLLDGWTWWCWCLYSLYLPPSLPLGRKPQQDCCRSSWRALALRCTNYQREMLPVLYIKVYTSLHKVLNT